MNKNWGDLNFVGRRALNWWPGNADVGDATYVPLLQTSGDGGKKKKRKHWGKIPPQFAWTMPRKIPERGIVLCRRFVGWRKPQVPARSRDMTRSFLQGSSGTGSASFLGWCSWRLISSMDGRGGVLCSFFFPEMIAFSLALLYPASLVGAASIFIYHYTVSLGKAGCSLE